MSDSGKAPPFSSNDSSARPTPSESNGEGSDAGDFLLSAYDYTLPEQNIAQTPCDRRDESRLLIVDRDGRTQSRVFNEIEALLGPGTLVVMNNTRVMPARLFARKESGGSIELLRVHDPNLPALQARFMSKGARLKRTGSRIQFKDGWATLIQRSADGTIILEAEKGLSWEQVHEREGELPLPPYIRRPTGPSEEDETRYQTVFARESGAVAAPTAGLHFTEALLKRLRERQVSFATITLHVGPGTFQPVRSQDIRKHQIRPEWAEVPRETAEAP